MHVSEILRPLNLFSKLYHAWSMKLFDFRESLVSLNAEFLQNRRFENGSSGCGRFKNRFIEIYEFLTNPRDGSTVSQEHKATAKSFEICASKNR